MYICKVLEEKKSNDTMIILKEVYTSFLISVYYSDANIGLHFKYPTKCYFGMAIYLPTISII